ncbi:MAG: hypothetical protein LKG19_13390 [Saprospiraceae bacterium]|nr:hypothetical protein [Saprospiraceae bacterium]
MKVLKIFITSIIIVFCFGTRLLSQIKIGDNPSSINRNSVLEMESRNKGLRLPRISLIETINSLPLTEFVEGMFIYNVATHNDVSPGIYYCDGSKWIKVTASGNASDSWKLDGNSGTDSLKHFLGTKDLAPLILKSNNTERMRITENGWIGIGTTTPKSALQIHGQLMIDSISIGDIRTDQVLVTSSIDGRIKMIPSNSFLTGMLKSIETVLALSQSVFYTPDTIYDQSRIQLFRNGVMISFTVNSTNSIISEVPCTQGDEVRILQLR